MFHLITLNGMHGTKDPMMLVKLLGVVIAMGLVFAFIGWIREKIER